MRIIQQVSTSWFDMGILLGLKAEQLYSVEQMFQKNSIRCCYWVIDQWMGNLGDESYPVTWKGLCMLLCDIEKSNTAMRLKEALAVKGVTLE